MAAPPMWKWALAVVLLCHAAALALSTLSAASGGAALGLLEAAYFGAQAAPGEGGASFAVVAEAGPVTAPRADAGDGGAVEDGDAVAPREDQQEEGEEELQEEEEEEEENTPYTPPDDVGGFDRMAVDEDASLDAATTQGRMNRFKKAEGGKRARVGIDVDREAAAHAKAEENRRMYDYNSTASVRQRGTEKQLNIERGAAADPEKMRELDREAQRRAREETRNKARARARAQKNIQKGKRKGL